MDCTVSQLHCKEFELLLQELRQPWRFPQAAPAALGSSNSHNLYDLDVLINSLSE